MIRFFSIWNRSNKAFTLSEVVLATSVSGLVFLAIGSMWYFLTRTMATQGRMEQLRQEAVMVIENLNVDVGYKAIGSKGNIGLVLCSKCPMYCPPNAILGIKIDVDGDPKNGGEKWIYYFFDSIDHTLSKGETFPGRLISNRVQSITLSSLPSGASCGDLLGVKVNLVCRFSPGTPVGEDNPELSLNFSVLAHQISLR